MTGLEKIVNQIQEEAQTSVNQLLNEADEKADKILNEAKLACKQTEDKTAAEIKTIRENAVSRSVSAAEMRKKRILLEARQAIISECIQDAYLFLKSLDDKKYFELSERMISKYALPQDGIIYFSETDLKRLPLNFKETVNKIAAEKGGRLVISDDSRDIDGGFVLAYGGIEENCSFKALFDSARENLQDTARKILFPA